MLKMQTDESSNVKNLILSSMKAMRKSEKCTDSWKTDSLNCQTRNYLRQPRQIRVARVIEQRQRNDDTTHENTKSRSAYRLRKLSSHFSENIERRNARSIHSFSFVSFASYNLRLIG